MGIEPQLNCPMYTGWDCPFLACLLQPAQIPKAWVYVGLGADPELLMLPLAPRELEILQWVDDPLKHAHSQATKGKAMARQGTNFQLWVGLLYWVKGEKRHRRGEETAGHA